MLNFLHRRWFLIGLLIAIPAGFYIGHSASQERVATFPKWIVSWASGGLTFLILFLMSATLENRKLAQSFRSPGPVIWGTAVNYLLMPLLCLPLLAWQLSPDFRVGLMVAASVPATLAAASVWTRKSNGNDAVSLLVTMITNAACFLVTPLWLRVGLQDTVQLDAGELMFKLFLTGLLPIVTGQLFRTHEGFREFADRGKSGFGALAQVCILLIIFWGSIQGGTSIRQSSNAGRHMSWQPAVVVSASCLLLHLAAAGIAFVGARSLGFKREDAVATVYAGSQKTLPLGIFVAGELIKRGFPFAVIPMLIFHALQLLVDTLFVDPLAKWIAAERNEDKTAPAADV